MGTFLYDARESKPLQFTEDGILLRATDFDLVERGHSLAMLSSSLEKEDTELVGALIREKISHGKLGTSTGAI